MSALRRRDGPRVKYSPLDAGPYDTITVAFSPACS